MSLSCRLGRWACGCGVPFLFAIATSKKSIFLAASSTQSNADSEAPPPRSSSAVVSASSADLDSDDLLFFFPSPPSVAVVAVFSVADWGGGGLGLSCSPAYDSARQARGHGKYIA